MDFKKKFDMMPRKNLWNGLEKLKVPLELRHATIKLYENSIAKLKKIEGWSRDIKCNIGVEQGCPLSPTISNIYIDNLKDCLEEICCVGTTLVGIIITLLLYVDDIVPMARCPYDLEKQLRILQGFLLQYGLDY